MSQRIKSIDILKGVAILMIILCHYSQYYTVGAYPVFSFLQMGCPVFFVASGFGIATLIDKKYSKLNEKNLKEFYISRFRSLWPGYAFMVLLTLFLNIASEKTLGYTYITFGTNRSPSAVLTNILLIHGLFPQHNNSVMRGGWYIGATVLLYAFAPFLFMVIKNIRINRIAIALIFGLSFLICYVWAYLKPSFYDYYYNYFVFINHIPSFCIGMLLFFEKDKEQTRGKAINYGLISAALILLSYKRFYYLHPFNSTFASYAMALATFCILKTMMHIENQYDYNDFISRMLALFGKNSYTMFLVHAYFAWTFIILIRVYANGYGINLNNKYLFVLLFPVVVLLTYISGTLLKKLLSKIDKFTIK